MADSLVIFAATGGDLTGYDQGDVIEVLDANQSPGAAVEANPGGRFGFVYVEGRGPDHPAMRALLEPFTDGAQSAEILAKRRRQVDVLALGGAALTYLPFTNPLSLRVTIAFFNSATFAKSRQTAVQNRVGILQAKIASLQNRLSTLQSEL